MGLRMGYSLRMGVVVDNLLAVPLDVGTPFHRGPILNRAQLIQVHLGRRGPNKPTLLKRHNGCMGQLA